VIEVSAPEIDGAVALQRISVEAPSQFMQRHWNRRQWPRHAAVGPVGGAEHHSKLHTQDVVADGSALLQRGDAPPYQILVACGTLLEQRLPGMLQYLRQWAPFP
jgi:hypothetical protein